MVRKPAGYYAGPVRTSAHTRMDLVSGPRHMHDKSIGIQVNAGRDIGPNYLEEPAVGAFPENWGHPCATPVSQPLDEAPNQGYPLFGFGILKFVGSEANEHQVRLASARYCSSFLSYAQVGMYVEVSKRRTLCKPACSSTRLSSTPSAPAKESPMWSTVVPLGKSGPGAGPPTTD